MFVYLFGGGGVPFARYRMLCLVLVVVVFVVFFFCCVGMDHTYFCLMDKLVFFLHKTFYSKHFPSYFYCAAVKDYIPWPPIPCQ